MQHTLLIEKVENGFTIIDPQTGKVWVASSYYDITDVLRKYYIED